MIVTPYWPKRAKGIAAATAALGSSPEVIAKITETIPPITAFGGWAPPTGIFPIVINW